MTNKDAAWLENIFDSPNLNLEEICLLMNLNPTEPVYTNVQKEKVLLYTVSLEDMGYSVGLFADTERTELNGAYVLQVRKDAV